MNFRFALKNFSLARDAVEKYFTRVSQSPELRAQGLERLRRGLLADARDYFQQLARQPIAGPDTAAERGRALLLLAIITSETGSLSQAVELLEEPQAIFEELVSQFPDESEYQYRLAQALRFRGEWCRTRELWRPQQAEPAFDRAIQILGQLIRNDSGNREYRNELARCFHGRGTLQSARGLGDKAKPYLERALEIREQLAREDPQNADFQQGLARTLSMIAFLQTKGDKPDPAQALAKYKRALAIRRRLVQQNPGLPLYEEQLALGLHNLATAYLAGEGTPSKEAHQKAAGVYQESRALYEKLTREHPIVVSYKDSLARTLHDLAKEHRAVGRNADAAEVLEKALSLAEQLTRDHAGVKAYEVLQADILRDLGKLRGQAEKRLGP